MDGPADAGLQMRGVGSPSLRVKDHEERLANPVSALCASLTLRKNRVGERVGFRCPATGRGMHVAHEVGGGEGC